MARANNGGWDFVKVGATYQYKEDWFIGEVIVLEDNSTDDMYAYKLQIIEACDEPFTEDGIFDISHTKNMEGYYSGMMQLYEDKEYSYTPKWKKPN